MINKIKYFLVFLVACGKDKPPITIDKICINGHNYYMMNLRSIAQQLSDDGKPVKCQLKKK